MSIVTDYVRGWECKGCGKLYHHFQPSVCRNCGADTDNRNDPRIERVVLKRTIKYFLGIRQSATYTKKKD